mgnify:CR=1 FL=1
MRNLALRLMYDGTDFHGWQVQPNGITVQECLQDAVEKILGVRESITGCSRTDAGVHLIDETKSGTMIGTSALTLCIKLPLSRSAPLAF